MKTLIKFCEDNNLEIRIVTFYFQGFKVRRKGYDLVRNGKTVFTLEPKTYPKQSSFNDKWFVRGEKALYLKRLSRTELNKILP